MLTNSAFEIGGGKPKVFGISLDRKLLGCMYYEGKEMEFNFSKFWTGSKTEFESKEEEDAIFAQIKSEMAEINLNHGLIVRQPVTPDQGVGQSVAYDLRIVLAKNAIQPIDVFAVIHIADFGAVQQEGRHGDLAGRVVPRIGQVVGRGTHHEGSAFDGNQAGTDFLVVHFSNFKASVVGIIVCPTRRAR